MPTAQAKRKKKNKAERSLPFSYTRADQKQATLYMILLHIVDGYCSEEDFEILKKHVYYRLRNYSQADREEIFSDFLLAIASTRSSFQVWHVNLFIRQRLINAIKKLQKDTSKYILVDDNVLTFLEENQHS